MAWPFSRKTRTPSEKADEAEPLDGEPSSPSVEPDPTEAFVSHRLTEVSHSVSRQWTIQVDVPFDCPPEFDWAADERPTHPSVINHLKTLCHLDPVYFPSLTEGRADMIIEGEAVQMIVRFDDFDRDPWTVVRLEVGTTSD
jgi:hypothetical protein